MTKPIHPIRKMQQAMIRADIPREAEIIARHVRPLLDALEHDHTERWQHKHDTHCETCLLLDAWRADL